MGALNQIVMGLDGRVVWINQFKPDEFIGGPYAAASGANYELSDADYTIPTNNALYVSWMMVGPMPAVNSQNFINWQMWMDNTVVMKGKASNAPIPVQLYAPPGAKVRIYFRTMATDVGILPTLSTSLSMFVFDTTKDLWAWEEVTGVANPTDPATLDWP